jgi:hypothetical protein
LFIPLHRIDHNRIGTDGMVAIGMALQHNETLTVLK